MYNKLGDLVDFIPEKTSSDGKKIKLSFIKYLQLHRNSRYWTWRILFKGIAWLGVA